MTDATNGITSVFTGQGWTTGTEKLQLPSEFTVMKVVGEQRAIKHTSISKICLADMKGRKHEGEAIGVNSLLAITPGPEARELAKQFPIANQDGNEALGRPFRKVQLMLKMASQSLHSRDGMEEGKLRLNKSVFYPGWKLIGGSDVSCRTNQGDKSGTTSVEVGSQGKGQGAYGKAKTQGATANSYLSS